MTPQRIQLSRKRGYRKPAGAVNVARPGKFGNPFVVRERGVYLKGVSEWMLWDYGETAADAQRAAVRAFERWLDGKYLDAIVIAERRTRLLDALPELAGRDVACWCGLTDPCHGDALLRRAAP